MAGSWVRAVVGIVAFFVVLAIGLVVTGSIDATPGPDNRADRRPATR